MHATIDNSREVLRPFSLIGTGAPVITDFPIEDLTALRDIELEWARGVGIDTSRPLEAVASTATQNCINTVTGIFPNNDAQLDCVLVNDDPGPPVPA